MDVLLQGRRVAVVELHPVRLRGELVRVGARPAPPPRRRRPCSRVDPVEVDRVRMSAAVDEPNAQEIVLGGPDHGPRNRPVVRPRLEEDALRDLDRPVDRRQVYRGHGQARAEAGAAASAASRARSGRRSRRVHPHHRRMAKGRVVVVVMLVRGGGRTRAEQGERAGRDDRRQRAEQRPARDLLAKAKIYLNR